ncbi:hypothetical protein C2S51_027177 [Perilla frutescens var. frutescens]|nr:hypothetical protein C2S51_027177 [Perilla frutescens var. frutescens]
MQFYQVYVVLLFLCSLSTLTADRSYPTHFGGDVSVNCGSSGNSAARDGTEWLGDVQPKFTASLQMKGSSTASRVIHKLVSDDDPIPYSTARLSRSRFSYAFQVNPGQKILRLYFNPTSYKGYKRFKDLFAVDAGHFTLLSNFSASLTAYDLGVSSFVKEFYINIEENKVLDIVVSPASSQSLNTYAFINGIEIVSVPASLSYFHGLDTRLQVVGKSPVYVDNNTALEIVQRISLKQDFVQSAGNVRNMFGVWEMIPKQKHSKMMNNVTWKISVDVGFSYLVRLYFSKLGLKMVEIGGTTFKVHINEMIACTNIDIAGDEDDEDRIPMYKDYMVLKKGCKFEGKCDVLICLESDHELIDGHGPLKGFEVLKLSNHDNSLASPNPILLLPEQNASHWPIQNLHHLLGPRNIIATVVITLLAVLNIIIYTLREILEARGKKEENIPSARAKRLCRRFSLADMQLATRNFSDAHLIGKGGFGKVYKGVIDNGLQTVAIKRLKSNSSQGVREFLMEIETLTEVRHFNLVSLIGYCNENREMILVYEYMALGTLADLLYKHAANSENTSSLTWKQRLTICIGAGRGLDYLHTGNSIIHRDVKTSNILLDESFRAKVSDFGLAKHLSKSKLESHVSTKVKGTFGYIDPKYVATAKLTMKSDTYAFGVVLLEVLSGRRAVDPWIIAEDEQILTKWARENVSKGRADRIVDPNLRGEISEHSLQAFVEITEKCLHDEPNQRPTMAEVVLHLMFSLEQQESPKSPPPNELTSGLGETNLSVSTREVKVPSIDVPNHTPSSEKQAKSKVVIIEPPSGEKDGRKSKMQRSSRLWPWDAFRKRDNPAGNHGRKVNKINDGVLPIAFLVNELEDFNGKFGLQHLIAENSKGWVFHGVLKSGQVAAIKKLHYRDQSSDKEFLAQVSVVSSLKHENVVQLLGYCVDGGERALAYEFAPHGSLHDNLPRSKGSEHSEQGLTMSWAERVKIAVEAAKGLEYIHAKRQTHGNIKSRNILLFDEGEVAKISDLHMLSQSLQSRNDTINFDTISFLPCRGYDAPEYKYKLSWKSDVYSFGVVMLELVTGRKPFDHTLPKGEQSLGKWATQKLRGDAIDEFVDPRLEGDYPPTEVAKMAEIACRCVQYDADLRPRMSIVVNSLQSVGNIEIVIFY